MHEATAQRAGRKEWTGLAVLTLPTLLASIDLTVPNLALPAISKDLVPSSAQLLWIVDIYAFLLAGSLITMGTLGDLIGRRRLLMFGAAAFGAASVLAAYANSAELLIVARALLGLAGATLMPSTLSLVTAMFQVPAQRRAAIGVIIASVSGGTAIGPLLGGWLLEEFWWGSVFLIGVPVMVVLLALGPVLLPEHRAVTAGRLDPLSVLLSMAGVVPVIFGLKRLAEHGADLWSLVAVAAGLVFCVVFVHRQRTASDPLLDLRLFGVRPLRSALVTLLFGIFVLWGLNLYVAQFLQLVLGLSPLHAGLWTAPSAGGVILGSLLAPRLAHRMSPARVVFGGLLLAAAGFVLLTQVDPGQGPLLLVAGTVVISLGLGPMMTLSTDMVVGSAPPERVGAASALSSTAPQFGGALGIAVLGSIGTAVYQAGVPADAPDTLGAVVQHAPALLDTARQAFTDGLTITAGISAAILLATAFLTIRGSSRAA